MSRLAIIGEMEAAPGRRDELLAIKEATDFRGARVAGQAPEFPSCCALSF